MAPDRSVVRRHLPLRAQQAGEELLDRLPFPGDPDP
jgi:hypothetical protein